MNENNVVVLIGSGAIGVAIARRIAIGKQLVLADLEIGLAEHKAQELREAGFNVHTISCDASNRDAVQRVVSFASSLGNVVSLIHTAGVSPSQASVQRIFEVDLYGTAMILEEFGAVIAPTGAAIIIGSQSSYRLPSLTSEQNKALALTPAEALLDLALVKEVTDPLVAYQIAKRGNTLRVQAEAVKWGKKGARVNSISAGIIYTPLANDELNGINKEFYQNMLAQLPAKRGGMPDEIAALAEFIISEHGAYITGSDFLIDGGATAKFWWNEKV